MKYLYYTLYRLLLNVKTNDTPAYNAMFLLTILEGLNIQTIMLVLPLKRLENRFGINDQVFMFAIIPCFILMVINYFLYVKDADKILANYGATKKSNTIGVVVLSLYSIATFMGIFFVSNLRN